MSDGIGAARRRWAKVLRRRAEKLIHTCQEPRSRSYTARSGISGSGTALRHHHGTLFNQDMEPKRDFFGNIIRPISSIGPQGRASPLVFATSLRSTQYFGFFVVCRHTASPPISSGTVTGGVQ